MITPSEKEEIVNEITERMLLRIPEIVGNLITNYTAKIRVNKEFYSKYPKFKDHKELVSSIIEQVEEENPLMPFKDIMNQAVPKINRHIDKVKLIDTKTVKKPDLDFSQGEL
jgi:hypothetical protein